MAPEAAGSVLVIAGTVTVTEDGLWGGDCADETMTSTVGVVGPGLHPPAVDVERREIPGAGPVAIGVENRVTTVPGLAVLNEESNEITGPGPTAMGEPSTVTTVTGIVEIGEVLLTDKDGVIVIVTTASVGLPGLPLMVVVVTDCGDIGKDDVAIDISVTVLRVLALPSEAVTVINDGEVELGLAAVRYVTTCGLLALLKVVVIVVIPVEPGIGDVV